MELRTATRDDLHGGLPPGPWLIVVTGWTGAGKSTIADRLAQELDATVASFDWVMSGLRALPEVWAHIEVPVERQRRVGWNLLSRIAEQQLRRHSSCVVDLVARDEPRAEWAALADRCGAGFAVVECTCVDVDLHRSRVEGRDRAIPGWYELAWEQVQYGRERYQPLAGPKVVIDAAQSVEANLALVMAHLRQPQSGRVNQ
jgi:predicted kinase